MRALCWDGARLALARDAPDPRPAAGEALVRVHLAGICRTDLEITRGYLGFRGTPGHEWVGHVLAADDPALVGRRVVGEINLACGACPRCRAGLGRHCPQRRVLGIAGADGAFAELLAIPAANWSSTRPARPAVSPRRSPSSGHAGQWFSRRRSRLSTGSTWHPPSSTR